MHKIQMTDKSKSERKKEMVPFSPSPALSKKGISPSFTSPSSITNLSPEAKAQIARIIASRTETTIRFIITIVLHDENIAMVPKILKSLDIQKHREWRVILVDDNKSGRVSRNVQEHIEKLRWDNAQWRLIRNDGRIGTALSRWSAITKHFESEIRDIDVILTLSDTDLLSTDACLADLATTFLNDKCELAFGHHHLVIDGVQQRGTFGTNPSTCTTGIRGISTHWNTPLPHLRAVRASHLKKMKIEDILVPYHDSLSQTSPFSPSPSPQTPTTTPTTPIMPATPGTPKTPQSQSGIDNSNGNGKPLIQKDGLFFEPVNDGEGTNLCELIAITKSLPITSPISMPLLVCVDHHISIPRGKTFSQYDASVRFDPQIVYDSYMIRTKHITEFEVEVDNLFDRTYSADVLETLDGMIKNVYLGSEVPVLKQGIRKTLIQL